MLELAQNRSLAQKGHLEALGASSPQGLDGHGLFPPSSGLQAAPAHFSKGAWENRCRAESVEEGLALKVSCPGETGSRALASPAPAPAHLPL